MSKRLNENEFISHCVNSLEMKRLFPNELERSRICYQKWIDAKGTNEWTRSLFDLTDVCENCGNPLTYDENVNEGYCENCNQSPPAGDGRPPGGIAI